MDLVPSQEPQAPAAPRDGKTRAQTRRTKLLEETQQQETLPTGDELEVRQVRQVTEVTKRVAVVRKGRSRRQPAATEEEQEAEDEEEEEEEEEQEEEQAAAPRRRPGRRSAAARMEAELDAAMGEELAQRGCPSTAPTVAPAGGTVRAYRQVVVEDGAPEEEAPAAGRQVTTPKKGGAGRRRGQAAPAPEPEPEPEPEAFLPETQLQEEPGEWAEVVQAAQAAIAGEEESDEEGSEGYGTPVGPSPMDFQATPPDLQLPSDQRILEEEEEEAGPSRGRRRGAAAAGREEQEAGLEGGAPGAGAARGGAPVTPAAGLRGALAEVGHTFADRLRGVLGSAIGAGGPHPAEAEAGMEEEEEEEEVEEEEEEEEAVVAPAKKAQPRGRPAATKKAVPRATKGGKAVKRGGKRRARREETYKRYIFKVLRQVHPDLRISSKSMSIMHSMVVDLFDRITAEAAHLTTVARHKTLTAQEVQTAVRLLMPGELSRQAVSEGKKAVGRMAGLELRL